MAMCFKAGFDEKYTITSQHQASPIKYQRHTDEIERKTNIISLKHKHIVHDIFFISNLGFWSVLELLNLLVEKNTRVA